MELDVSHNLLNRKDDHTNKRNREYYFFNTSSQKETEDWRQAPNYKIIIFCLMGIN